MTEYTEIPLSNLEAGDPLTATQAQAFVSNPVAMSEMDPTCRASGVFAAGAWHVEDGSNGTDPVYDFSVDGTVASVVTPNFEEGFDYKLILEGVSHDAVTDQNLQMQLFAVETSSYSTPFNLNEAGFGAPLGFWGSAELTSPMRTLAGHVVLTYGGESVANSNTAIGGALQTHLVTRATPSAMRRIRVQPSFGSIDAGKIWLLKRRGEIY